MNRTLLIQNKSRLVAKVCFALILSLLTAVFPLSALAITSTDTKALGYDALGSTPGNNAHPHNFSIQSQGGIKATDAGDPNATRICVYCHTPHGGTAQSPLWSRTDPDSTGWPLFRNPGNIAIDDNAPLTGYTDADPTAYPNGATKLCLSCHDGLTAIDQMTDDISITLNYSNMDAWIDSAPDGDSTKAFLRPDLSGSGTLEFDRTHPVSFIYDANVVAYINGPASAGRDTYSLPTDNILDSQNRMQCTTCHDPHLDTFDTPAGYNYPMWRKYTGNDTNDFDNTCNQCHAAAGGSGHTN